MRDSISRKTLALAVVVMAVPVAVTLYVPSWGLRLLSLGAATLGVLAAWAFSRSLTGRINALAVFVDRVLDPGPPAPRLKASDDELGSLARSVSRMALQIDELIVGLRTELARREAILASMTEAVLAVDVRLNVTFCNQSFLRLVGDHFAQQGVSLLKLLRDPVLFQVLKQAVEQGETLRKRLQLSGMEGRSFEVYAAPLAGGSPRGAIAILTDVTPLERLERMKRDFIANVSHEFRTPLATIRGFAETLLEGGLEDTGNRRRFVEIIQANGVRLHNIASDLLTLSEMEGGAPEPESGPVSVRDAVSNAVRAVEPAASIRGVRLRVEPMDELSVLGHSLRLEQAVVNLLDNAVKFNSADGEVRVAAAARPDGHIEISVADTGIGIPHEDQTRIFERFYRVDKARSRAMGGTGLGLSIVKHAVEQMNGSVAVESEPGKGSKFTITLPPQNR